jgi:hypothetical protein
VPFILFDVVLGVIAGVVLAVLLSTLLLTMETHAMTTTVNGWKTTQACGVPSNWLLEAACASYLPATNVPKEAVYWQVQVDGNGTTLDGSHDYVIRFPTGGLPPTRAFWSITVAGANRLMVANPYHKYSVSSHSGLQVGPDRSVVITLQRTPPAGNAANWIPTPSGRFMLWLRDYEPGHSVLDGTYKPPPVKEVRS